MATPEERKIRKTELWERIDRNNALIQRKADDNMKAVEALGVKLQTLVDNAIKKIDKDKVSLGDESRALYDSTLVKFSDIITQAVDKLGAIVNQDREDIDQYIAAFRESSEAEIEESIARRLDDYVMSSKIFHEQAEEFKQGVAKQMTKYQADTLSRYEILKKEVNKLRVLMEKKLKK